MRLGGTAAGTSRLQYSIQFRVAAWQRFLHIEPS
jgi:hypothetical protein